jgi:tetratricopeptide (TPR) repeat protein
MIDRAVIHYNIGVCYQTLKNNDNAKREFTKVIEIMPKYIKARASRMNILKIEGEYEKALEDAENIYN